MSDDKSIESPDAKTEDSTPPELAEEPKPSELEIVSQKLEQAEKETLYLRAEFDNFRKQSIKERSDLIKFGGESIARDLLNVLDIFEKALELELNPENLTAFKEGVSLTEKELKSVFTKHGISEVDCKGKAFDPTKSEALGQVPTKDVTEGNVLEVMRKGYLYHDKVLRHAQVVVAAAPIDNKA